ncbi:hypothetical protein ACRDNQ_03555 [Palleronia sp. KMU-117]|uniref:hypothetical protein n=1 Tax=Palleronia sp. KMU-117 TaxID=3434108 RepID=UPI003D739484
MTMFSMKPKFNLAEFLAEPAKPNSARRRKAMNSAPPEKPATEVEAADGDAPAATKKKKTP